MYVLVVLTEAKAKTIVKVKEGNDQAKKIINPSKPKVKTVKKVYSFSGQKHDSREEVNIFSTIGFLG